MVSHFELEEDLPYPAQAVDRTIVTVKYKLLILDKMND